MPHDICVLYMFSLRLWKLIYPCSTSISDSPSNCWTPVTCWLLAAQPFSLENSFFNNDRLRPLRKTVMSIWKCQKKKEKKNLTALTDFLKKQHLLKVIIVPIDYFFLQQIVPGCVIRFMLNLMAKIQALKQTLEILKAKSKISYKVLLLLQA